MTESERLARDLGEWLADTANPHMPDYVEDILRATARQRQRPRWGFIGRPMDRAPHALRPTARAVLLGLGLALLMALLLAMLLIPLSGSRQADPVKPRLGPDIPEGAVEGIIETPLGRARWVHLSGDTSTLPQEPSRWPTTWASFVGDAPFTHLDLEAGFRWTSNDGMRWVSESISQPIDADTVLPHDGGGARWLMALGPPGIWRSTDGQSWRPIDLESILPASPAALVWEIEPSFEMASTDTATVAVVTARATEPFATLEWPLDPGPGDVSEREPGLIVFAGSEEWETPDRYLRFEGTSDGMRVIEVADGSIIADLDGVTYADVLAWVRDGPPVEHHIALIEGDRLVPTFRLADFGDGYGSSMGTMLGTSDAILALILSTPLGPAHLWRSEDGRDWTDLGPWDLPGLGESGGDFQIGASRGHFHVQYDGMVWHSMDGLTWDVVAKDVPADTNLHELDSGFVTQGWREEDGITLSASRDGRTWKSLDLSAAGLMADRSGFTGLGVVGDTVFIVFEDERGQRDLWILSYDTVPA